MDGRRCKLVMIKYKKLAENMILNTHAQMRHKQKYKSVPLWAFVSDITALGSTSSAELCRGLDGIRIKTLRFN